MITAEEARKLTFEEIEKEIRYWSKKSMTSFFTKTPLSDSFCDYLEKLGYKVSTSPLGSYTKISW